MIDTLEGFNNQLAALSARLDKLDTVQAAHTEALNILRFPEDQPPQLAPLPVKPKGQKITFGGNAAVEGATAT